MTARDSKVLSKQRHLLLDKLQDFETTNSSLRGMLRDEHKRQVLHVCPFIVCCDCGDNKVKIMKLPERSFCLVKDTEMLAQFLYMEIYLFEVFSIW